jgi:murein DD-endopeptidase MepM/ murein hydrolase activator NlpD
MAALCAALALSACAHPQAVDSGHEGLFDVLSRSDREHPARARANREERVARSGTHRGPAAVAVEDLGAPRPERPLLQWPLSRVAVTSPFGRRGGEFHEGVDLKASEGTTVVAAQDGVVLYAGHKIRGYGNLVVLKHSGGVSTIYAHNSKLLVKAGERVKRGSKIALSGRTGHARGPHLHFEVREGTKAVDPMIVLPPVGVRTARR